MSLPKMLDNMSRGELIAEIYRLRELLELARGRGKRLEIKRKERAASSVDPALDDLFILFDYMGLTGDEAARYAGFHPVTISRWRHGALNPRFVDVMRMANGAGLDLQWVKRPDIHDKVA